MRPQRAAIIEKQTVRRYTKLEMRANARKKSASVASKRGEGSRGSMRESA